MLAATNAIIRVGFIWLSGGRLDGGEKERKELTRLFQSNDLEARGVNALEVAPEGVCARARRGPAARARDRNKAKGAMGIGRGKKRGWVGRGKGRGLVHFLGPPVV